MSSSEHEHHAALSDTRRPHLSGIRRYCRLVTAAAASAGILIVLGGAVAFMGAAKSIPDWPASFGSIAPPAEAGALVEYLHRLFAVLSGLLVAGAAVVGLRRHRFSPWLSVPPVVSIGLLAIVATLGAIVVLSSIPPALAAVDLGSALMVLALMLTAAVAGRTAGRSPDATLRLSFRDPFARIVLAASVALYLALASGLSVGVPAPDNALGLPLWGRFVFTGSLPSWLQLAQLALSGAAGALAVLAAAIAWRRRRTDTATLCLATVIVVLYVAATLTGELAFDRGLPWLLMGVRVVTTVALWAAIVCLAALEGFREATRGPARSTGAPTSKGANRAKDLASMTRPLVTLLLLVTALAGMIAANGELPPLGRTVLTLGALALAAGGAQALNQYLERDLDAAMTRTALRPLPSGRLAPAEGAAWGLCLSIASLYLLADLVSVFAAALAALGMFWYLVVYTIVLKPRSAASVVVGGAAGALMPLVGSAAASGGLSTMAILISAIVFLWTPPHFWSLAVLRVQDYSNAGVPVLPLVKGEARARARILGSSILLAAASIGVAAWESARPAFLAAAAALGALLVYRAWECGRGGDRAAARMYRYSSIYLGLLLVVVVTDRLI